MHFYITEDVDVLCQNYNILV